MSNVKSDTEKLNEVMNTISFDFSQVKDVKWQNPIDSDVIEIKGFPWLKKDGVYRRLPVDAKEKLRPPVNSLADCTAGGQIQFITDSKRLYIAVKLQGKANMYHMPATGQCGFDCYVGDESKIRYYKTCRFDLKEDGYCSELFNYVSCKSRTIVLNFPLYIGVEHVLIGVDDTATINKPDFFVNDKKIVIYGTSITQGGCASRPGMAYSNILSRMFHMECVNLGFSGNGQGDSAVAKLMSEIENVSCYVLDHITNCSTQLFMETLPGFVKILKERNPDVPVCIMSNLLMPADYFLNDIDLKNNDRHIDRQKVKDFIIDFITDLEREGYTGLYFIESEKLLGEDFEEGTVDGTHPNDFGFYNIAKGLYPLLKSILKDSTVIK